MKSSPFIHLIKTINGYYVFDVNTNQIISVKEDTFLYLQKVLNNQEEYDPFDSRTYALAKKGFLSNKRVKTLKHPATDVLKNRLNRKVSKITLQVTQSCNLR